MDFDKLFRGADTSTTVQTPIEQTINALQHSIAGRGGRFAADKVVRQALAIESFDNATRAEMHSVLQDLATTIRASVSSVQGAGKVNLAQESAAVAAGLMGSSPADFLRMQTREFGQIQSQYANANTSVIGHSNITEATSRQLSLEAYDNKENKNAVLYSVAYNMQAAKQDDFVEAFFPTVVVTPDNVGFMVSMRLHFVQNDVRRALSGSLTDFGRKNIIKAVVDPTILRTDQTRIVPVVRTGGGANDSTANFVAAADVTPYSVMLDSESILTAPLKVGKRFDLLANSQTAALIESGVLGVTDAIDSSLRLSAVYVKIAAAGPAPAKVIKFDVRNLPFTDFNAVVQGNTRTLQLAFDTKALRVTADTKATDGSAIDQLTALTTYSVRLEASLFGTVTQDTGATVINTGDITVNTVISADKQVLSTTSGTGATIAAVFTGATVIGYDLFGYRTNSNVRQRGQLVDTQMVNQLYTVPLLSPITAMRPVGETEGMDAAMISSLVTTTKIRSSNSGVGTLLEARDFLKSYVNDSDPTLSQPEILGMARHVLDAKYLEEDLNVRDQIDSLKSSERAADLTALIINKIRDMAYRLYTESAYKAALDSIYEGAAGKPLLIIGTDTTIARYLTLQGDLRLLGEYFDYRLVETLDNRMRGKIVFSFGMNNSYDAGAPNPLHFGNTAYKPELTLMMPIARNGQTSYELTVQPSFRHVVNLPIMGYITVTNIEDIIADKATVNFHSIP